MPAITIAGHEFDAPIRYQEGHQLNANEAAALNQTYHENLRNNFAKKVRDAAKAHGVDLDSGQTLPQDVHQSLHDEFQTHAEGYQFGHRTPGAGRAPSDPVKRVAVEILVDKIRELIRTKGGKVADYKASDITAKARAILEDPANTTGQQAMAVARERIEQEKSVASDSLNDLLSNLEPAQQAA